MENTNSTSEVLQKPCQDVHRKVGLLLLLGTVFIVQSPADSVNMIQRQVKALAPTFIASLQLTIKKRMSSDILNIKLSVWFEFYSTTQGMDGLMLRVGVKNIMPVDIADVSLCPWGFFLY